MRVCGFFYLFLKIDLGGEIPDKIADGSPALSGFFIGAHSRSGGFYLATLYRHLRIRRNSRNRWKTKKLGAVLGDLHFGYC